jgi:MFS family permease
MMRLLRNRWWVVVGSVIGLTVSAGPVNNFTFGVFLRAVTEDLHIGRGTFASAMLATNWIGAASGPVLGWLLDRFGAKRVLLVGVTLFAIATAMQAYITSSLLVLYLLFALKNLTSAGQSPVAYAFAVSKWFDRRRGLALGVALAGVGLGTSVVPLTAAYLIAHYGWRLAYAGIGVLVLILGGLPALFLIREPGKQEQAAALHLAGETLPGYDFLAVLKGGRFWALAFAFLLGVVALNGIITQIVPILMDRGVSLQVATRDLAASGIAALLGRIASGWCVDRYHGPYVATAFFILPMIGTMLFATGAGEPWPLLGALLCGAALGAEIDLMGFFVSRYFGLKSYGKIYGTMFGIFAGATGVGPFISGFSFDHWHSYLPAFALYEVVLAIACLTFLPLGAYPFPAHHRGGEAYAAEQAPA